MITLKDFLKKYTAISNSFIDEYFLFYDKCENKKFGIMLDEVLDYLDIKERKDFYSRFRKRYNVKYDYQILEFNYKKEKNKKNVIYYVSFDTFEKICMMSKAEKAEKVRDYFILLRKFINYYKNHISNMISKSKKYIYILLVNKNKDIFKIGNTTNIRNRLRTYATGTDVHPDIKFIMTIDEPKQVEQCIKIFLKDYEYKKGHEIYKIDIDLIKSVIFSCNELNNIKEHKNSDAYIIYDEYDKLESINYLDNDNNIIGYEKIIKKTSKKTSKKASKKTSKKASKKASKKTSKKASKKAL
jgi:phage anti-repressor protein